MKIPSELHIRAMTPEQRSSLHRNASGRSGPEAEAVLAMLNALGLPYSSGGMSKDDPVYIEMEEIIFSADGIAAAIAAIAEGQPAMAKVDPLLQQKMGRRYRVEAQGTMTAGALVADAMRSQGYEVGPAAALPAGCLAQTAATFRPKTALR